MAYYIGIDLGSTNLKAALYDGSMQCVDSQAEPVEYDKTDEKVEFDAEQYARSLMRAVASLVKRAPCPPDEIAAIGLTGQAETLVVQDDAGKPLIPAISWMDERSREECAALSQQFTPEEILAVTGQMAVLPTWPATKILWLKNHQPQIFEKAACYMLLKDYIVWYLTGKKMADCSIATFSFYFDIYNRCYWDKILAAIGIRKEQLPPLASPCTAAGTLTQQVAAAMGLPESVQVNLGTLDHFAGMIGTGNTKEGCVSLSTGTVMALATMAGREQAMSGIAMHYGFIDGTWVMLPVAESGGASLEWFRSACMPGIGYDRLNEELAKRDLPGDIIFLPYLVGTNAPEFDEDASGLFYGLRAKHDAFDMAAAVMEGVAFLLKKNCDSIIAAGKNLTAIIATGGGAKSDIWCQMQADITQLPILVPKEKEAACLGAAICAAVGRGDYESFEEAYQAGNCVEKRFTPAQNPAYERKYRQFCALYDAMIRAARTE